MIHIINSVKELKNAMTIYKYVIIKFTAPWCGPCLKIAPKIHDLSQQYHNIYFIEVDIDSIDDEILTEYYVSSIPKIISFKNGEIIDTCVGANINKVTKIIESLDKNRNQEESVEK